MYVMQEVNEVAEESPNKVRRNSRTLHEWNYDGESAMLNQVLVKVHRVGWVRLFTECCIGTVARRLRERERAN